MVRGVVNQIILKLLHRVLLDLVSARVKLLYLQIHIRNLFGTIRARRSLSLDKERQVGDNC